MLRLSSGNRSSTTTNPYDILARPFNLLTASLLLMAASLSYDSTSPKSTLLVLTNLVFSLLAYRLNRRLQGTGMLYFAGGGMNIYNARNPHGQLNEPLFLLGGAIFGAGVLWLTLVLHKAFVYNRLRRLSVEESESEDELDLENLGLFERKDEEEYAREVIIEMMDRTPTRPIEVQLQVERIEHRD